MLTTFRRKQLSLWVNIIFFLFFLHPRPLRNGIYFRFAPFDLCTIQYGPIVTGCTKYLMAHKKTKRYLKYLTYRFLPTIYIFIGTQLIVASFITKQKKQLTGSLLLFIDDTGLLLVDRKQGTPDFLQRCSSDSNAGKMMSKAAAWNTTNTALCKQKTRSAGTGTVAAARNVAEFKRAEDTTVGPVHCNTSGGVRSLFCAEIIRNMSLMARPTLTKGSTWTLRRFIGMPRRLQTPKPAADELARTRTPSVAMPDWTSQPKAAASPSTIPIFTRLFLECSANILFNVAVEKVLKLYDEDDILLLVSLSISCNKLNLFNFQISKREINNYLRKLFLPSFQNDSSFFLIPTNVVYFVRFSVIFKKFVFTH